MTELQRIKDIQIKNEPGQINSYSNQQKPKGKQFGPDEVDPNNYMAITEN